VTELGGLGLEKLAARRRIEIKIGHFDRRTLRLRAGSWLGGDPAFAFDAPTMRLGRAARGQDDPGDRGDAGEGFPTKPQAGYAFQVIEGGDLAGCMTRESEGEFRTLDAGSFVGDANEPTSAVDEVDAYVLRACVETVLEQFLERGRGTIDHLSGGDLVDEIVRQDTDSGHLRRLYPLIERHVGSIFLCESRPGISALLAVRSRQAGFCLRSATTDRVRDGMNHALPTEHDSDVPVCLGRRIRSGYNSAQQIAV
jgi:hypothetical protein